MRTLTPREWRLLVLTVSTLAAAMAYVYLVEPRIQRGLELRAALEDSGKKLGAYEGLLRNRDEIMAHADSLQKQIVTADDPEAELTSLLKEVEQLSQKARIESISLRPQQTREHSFYMLMGIQLSAEGSAEDIARFLHHVRESAQLLRVDGLTCNALKQKSRLRADFTIVKVLNPGEG